mmetsp:Transcript_1481/g.4035  ORF Transcript_1481/g.4035 Transcript_1481/m.4035 type:complete len:231 (-) Transcript_1481:137-829(-)
MVLPDCIKRSCSKAQSIWWEGWWIEHSTVTPRADKSLKRCTMLVAEAASRPLVGSSMNRTRGKPPINDIAILSRFRSPLEMPRTPICSSPTRVSAQTVSLTDCSMFSMRFVRSISLIFLDSRSSAANPRLSRTVKPARNVPSCGTKLDTARIKVGVTLSPPHRISPLRAAPGERRPRRRVNKVVFPEPLAPMMAVGLPAGKLHVMLERSVRRCGLPGTSYVTRLRSKALP